MQNLDNCAQFICTMNYIYRIKNVISKGDFIDEEHCLLFIGRNLLYLRLMTMYMVKQFEIDTSPLLLSIHSAVVNLNYST